MKMRFLHFTVVFASDILVIIACMDVPRCSHVQMFPHADPAGDQKLCESLSEKNCRVQAADLRDIFWEAMKEGDLRLSLQTFLERFRFQHLKRCVKAFLKPAFG